MYFPKLEYLDFLQEGYRLEYSHPEDPFDPSDYELSEHETNMAELASTDVGQGDIEVIPVENKSAAHMHSQGGVKKGKAEKKSKKPKLVETLKYKGIVFNEMKGALVRMPVSIRDASAGLTFVRSRTRMTFSSHLCNNTFSPRLRIASTRVETLRRLSRCLTRSSSTSTTSTTIPAIAFRSRMVICQLSII